MGGSEFIRIIDPPFDPLRGPVHRVAHRADQGGKVCRVESLGCAMGCTIAIATLCAQPGPGIADICNTMDSVVLPCGAH